MPRLVLSRKELQTIVIGELITLTIQRIGTKNVRIAIDAPAEISIRRGELEKDD